MKTFFEYAPEKIWIETGDGFVCHYLFRELNYRYELRMLAGRYHHSQPQFKLWSPSNYEGFELQFFVDGRLSELRAFLVDDWERTCLPGFFNWGDTLDTLGLVPGLVQPNISVDSCARIIAYTESAICS